MNHTGGRCQMDSRTRLGMCGQTNQHIMVLPKNNNDKETCANVEDVPPQP